MYDFAAAACRFRWVAVIVSACVLASCSHVPVTSLLKLSQIDFVTTDPALMRAAVKLPRQLRPRPDGMRLHLVVKMNNGSEEAQDFALREVSDAADLLALRDELSSGSALFAYRIDPDDLARLKAFRATMLAKKNTGVKGSLTISVRPETCRTETLGEGPVLFSTYLRTSETGSYVPLTRDVDLRSLDATRDIAALIPPCA